MLVNLHKVKSYIPDKYSSQLTLVYQGNLDQEIQEVQLVNWSTFLQW